MTAGNSDVASAPLFEVEVQDRQAASGQEVIGEVVEANTNRFVAQCPRERLHNPPIFGAFVKIVPQGQPAVSAASRSSEIVVDDPFADPVPRAATVLAEGTVEDTLYALVYHAATGSAEPGRRPSAYGLSEEQLREEQPQIFDLLATEFAALHIGIAKNGRVRIQLPPQPPRLHAFVYACSSEEVCGLTETPDFVRSLLTLPGEANADELMAACLRTAYQCHRQNFGFLVQAGKQLASLLREDPERLAALLRKLEP